MTALVFVGAGLVYLSLIVKSVLIFMIGELVCLLIAPFILWSERGHIRKWWDMRGRCPVCRFDLRAIKGKCPSCGHKRIVD